MTMTLTQTLNPGILSVPPSAATMVSGEPKKESPLGKQLYTVAREILNSKSVQEADCAILSNLPKWHLIKTELVHKVINNKFSLKNYAAACNLSLGELDDTISEGKGKKLGSEAELALRMSLDTMSRNNRLMLERMMMAGEQARKMTAPATPAKQVNPPPAMVTYVSLIPRIEMLLASIGAYVDSLVKPKRAQFVDDLAFRLQGLTEELAVAAAELGLETPSSLGEPLDDQTGTPMDKDEAEFADRVWTDASKALRAEEAQG
jgi:hypothetical protein